MLSEKQNQEILTHLEKAQNPIFLYDNDDDGLCSFVLFRRFIGRGKGIAIRSYPELDVGYAKRAQELGADYIFVLDKPILSKEFLEEVDAKQLPLVWIDHHPAPEQKKLKKYKNVFLYNPQFSRGKNKSSEPVTALAYSITQRKEDVWIAVLGCIADHYWPSFVKEFSEKYGEFWGKVEEPFDAYYKTEIGNIARALNFGLKDSVSHVIELQNFLISCKHPSEVLSEGEKNSSFRNTYKTIRDKYEILRDSAEEKSANKFIFFSYGGETSMSADLANELSYRHPEKYVVMVYANGAFANVSLRGKNVRDILAKVLNKMPGSTGGGHSDAAGARIKIEEVDRFKEIFEKEAEKNEH